MSNQGKMAIAGVLALLLSASSASAQLFDHDRCYKIKDSANFRIDVTLSMFQEAHLGLPEDCRVKGRAKFFCAPAAKDPHAGTFVDNSNPPLSLNGFQGDNQRYDKLCYKVKCPDLDAPAVLDVNDQFGSRSIRGLKTQMMCTPTYKLEMPPDSTTTTTTTLPQPYCGDGIVNQASEQCDGADAAACLVDCNSDCTCNNIVLTPYPKGKLTLVIPEPPGGGGPEVVELEGVVVRRDGPETGEGTGTIETEIVSMDLTGGSSLGQIRLRTPENPPSGGQGTLIPQPDGTFRIDSFFDVFTELTVDGPGGQCQHFQSDGPIQLGGQTAVPPQAGESVGSGPTGCVAIVDSFFDIFLDFCDIVLTFDPAVGL